MALTGLNAFATLADLKSDVGVTDASQDAALERRILAASAMVEASLNRPVRRVVGEVEKLPGLGGVYLLLQRTPIEAVTQVTLEGVTVDATTYAVAPLRDALYAPAGWRHTWQGVVTLGQDLQPVPGAERLDYEVTYTGGWWLPNDVGSPPGTAVLLPAPVVEATVMLAASLWWARGRDGTVQAEASAEASVQYRVASEGDGQRGGMPATVWRMLAPWRRAT